MPGVVADTSLLRYLVLIGQVELLPALYTEVLIPEAVADELSHPVTPTSVKKWIARPPSWLQIVPVLAWPASVSLDDLDRGERDAILLALNLRADLVLMDEREGVEEARRLNLTVTGTVGVWPSAGCWSSPTPSPTCFRQISGSSPPYSTACWRTIDARGSAVARNPNADPSVYSA